jgi:hypothetical protein
MGLAGDQQRGQRISEPAAVGRAPACSIRGAEEIQRVPRVDRAGAQGPISQLCDRGIPSMRRRHRTRPRLRNRLHGLLCCLMLFSAAATGERVERLDYRVSYRGVFSLGVDMPIADLSLESRRIADTGLSEARLEISSYAYPQVESLYPIRYRFRSWAESDTGELFAFSVYEQTRDGRHQLFLRDESTSGTRRHDLRAGDGREQMAQLDGGSRPRVPALPRLLFDRLGLLQRMRSEDLRTGAEYRIPVTNGRQRFSYRVRVEGEQWLKLAEAAVPAWKLRFDGVKMKADGRQETAHLPLYIWLGQEAGRTPLRVEARHAIGLFRIELDGRPKEIRSVRRSPIASLSRPPVSSD